MANAIFFINLSRYKFLNESYYCPDNKYDKEQKDKEEVDKNNKQAFIFIYIVFYHSLILLDPAGEKIQIRIPFSFTSVLIVYALAIVMLIPMPVGRA